MNLLNGANKQMKLSPTFYGQKARKLIVDAVILMLQDNISLTCNNFKNG